MRDFLDSKFRQAAGFLFIFISVVNVESSLFRLPNCFGYGHFVELEGKSGKRNEKERNYPQELTLRNPP